MRLRTPKLIRFSTKDVLLVSVLPPVLVFIALIMLIFVSWRTAIQDVKTLHSNSVNSNSNFVQGTIAQRFGIYEHALRAATGFFKGSENVSRREWRNFVHSLQLPNRYPGIQAVGYAKVVKQDDLKEFAAGVRQSDLPAYKVFPKGQRKVYAPVLYLVPTAEQKANDRNAAAIGYDMYSNASRREAMDKAAQTGEPIISDTLELLSDNTAKTHGFLLYMPVYKKNMPLTTMQQRQAAIDGFMYAPFTSESLFRALFAKPDEKIGFLIYEGEPYNSNLVYKSTPLVDAPEFKEAKRALLPMYGQDWNIVYKASSAIVPAAIRERPLSTAFGGTVFAFALALIIYLLIQRRTRSLAYNEEKRLEQAKDELLSLASHQLRTPATAVKQYISMVKEGYAGKLNREQKSLLKMAYESNERQLTIVDDLLYVARVDSGQATPKIEKIDIINLLKSVISDFKSSLEERNQKVTFKPGRRPVLVKADPYYLRMIYENLLSNASKYSREATQIKVSVGQDEQNVWVDFTDQGVGISDEDFPGIFLKFSRIPNELTRQTPGSGIGLYLAKKLALLHDGDITFTSRKGKGSVFTVTLPRIQTKK